MEFLPARSRSITRQSRPIAGILWKLPVPAKILLSCRRNYLNLAIISMVAIYKWYDIITWILRQHKTMKWRRRRHQRDKNDHFNIWNYNLKIMIVSVHIIDMITSYVWSNQGYDGISDIITLAKLSHKWNDHISEMITSVKWSHQWKDHISEMITSVKRSHQWNDRISEMITSVKWSVKWSHQLNDHISEMITAVIWSYQYSLDHSSGYWTIEIEIYGLRGHSPLVHEQFPLYLHPN